VGCVGLCMEGVRMDRPGQGLEPKSDRLAFRISFINRFSFSLNLNDFQIQTTHI
jgi:hypothetical protein